MDNKRSNKKKIIVIQSLKYTLMFGVGYYFGIKHIKGNYNKSFRVMAQYGIAASKFIDGKEYIVSLTQK